MADQFSNPQNQAELGALRASLDSLRVDLSTRLSAVEQQIARDTSARRTETTTSQATARTSAQGIVADASPAAVREGSVAAKALGEEQAATAISTRQMSAALGDQSRVFAQMDGTLAKTGALTDGFIGSLRAGNATLGQFGDQMLTTIGKFAGWTGAAAAVYGALAALNDIKKGAIDTQSAIQGLTRFIPNLDKEQAQKQIADEATTTVTPVKDVGTAAQSFARIFKDQGDVFTATHVALSASKLDNIALADSYRYLTSITQEYGLSANQLPGVFDQVTAAQDRMGAKVSELLPAIARSAAAIKNSGGDINQALALEATAIVRTGQTGNTVGTAFARGAANFYKSPSSQATLEQYGIDPKQGVTQAIIQAVVKGASGALSGDDIRAISKAFFGPLRGGILQGLFRSNDTLQQALQQTSPDAAAGLAGKQLAKVTEQPDQRIKQLGIDLQALGAALGSSGLLTDLGAMVALLNSFLQATTQLLRTFNQLPSVIKDIVGVVAPLVGIAAVARRFGVTLGPLGATNAFRKNEAGYLGSEIAGLQNQASSGRAQYRAAGIEAQSYANQAALVGDGEEKNRLLALEERALARQNQIALSNLTIQSEITAFQEEQTAVLAESRTQSKARQAGTAGAAGAAGALDAEAAANARLAVTAEGATLATGELAVATGTGLVASLGRAAAAVKAFIFGIGGLAVAAEGYILYRGATDESNRQSQGLTKIQQAKTAQQVRDAQQSAESPHGILDSIYFYAGGGNENPFRGDTNSAIDEAARAQQNTIQADAHAKAVGHGRLDQIQNGLDAQLPNLHTAAEKAKAVAAALVALGNDKALALEDPGALNAAKDRFNKLLAGVSTTAETIDSLVGGINNSKDLKAFLGKTQLTFDIQGPGSSLGFKQATAALVRAAELAGQASDPTQLAADFKKANDLIKQQASGALQQALVLAGSDPGAIGTAQSDYLSKVQQPIDLLKAKLAGVNAQIKGANDGANAARARLAEVQKGAASGDLANIALSAVPGAQASQIANLKGTIGSFGAAGKNASKEAILLRELLAQLEMDMKVAQEQAAKATEQGQIALIDAQTAYAQSGTANPVQKAQYAFSGATQDLAKLAASGIKDPVQQLQLQTKQRDAVQQGIDAQLAQWQAQSQLALAQADQAANGNQGTILNDAVTSAQNLVSHLQSLGSKVDPSKLTGALQALTTAQTAVQNYARTEARALIDANASLAESQTTDPVVVARDQLDAAKKLLAFDQAHGASQSTLTKDQADVNAKRIALTKDIYTQQLQNIQFHASVQDISSAAELDQLQSLLKRMKSAHAAVSDIQNLEKTIYDLSHNLSGNVNLNLGNIKLPTAYEVRSAIAAGRNATKRQTTAGLLAEVKTDVMVNVQVHRDVDLGKFTDALSKALDTSVNGVAQAAGLV